MNIFATKKTRADHLLTLTKELIRIPSHPQEPLSLKHIFDFMQRYFVDEKVVIQRHMFEGYPSLVITMTETKHPHLLLAGHVDVVPSSNNYAPEEKDGWLKGSGAVDMKSGVAVMMAIMKYFSRQKLRPSLGIMITSDEEIGSHHGTHPLLALENYRANFVIINEGREKYEIVTREKGILVVTFVANGYYMHSAYPWKGENAVEALMSFLGKVKKIFPKPKNAWIPSAAVTVINAGRETNTIPGRAEATMNIRLTGGLWTKESILEKIRKILPKNIEITRTSYGEIFEMDPKHEEVRLLQSAVNEVVGRKVPFGDNPGASDAKLFQEHNIPIAILGPAGKNHHTPVESLEISSLDTHFEVLKRFIEMSLEREQQANERAKGS